MLRPSHIVIHNSATRDSGTVSWGAIRKYHTDTLGWDDIGYHFGIELVGDQYEILAGRMPNIQGAHCNAHGMNSHSLGVCCVGDFDKESVPEAQWNECLKLVRWLMEEYKIKADNVIGHREREPAKTCPGARFDMVKFRRALVGL